MNFFDRIWKCVTCGYVTTANSISAGDNHTCMLTHIKSHSGYWSCDKCKYRFHNAADIVGHECGPGIICGWCKQLIPSPDAHKYHKCPDKPQLPFRVGDVVEAFGVGGTVTKVEDDHQTFSVRVTFNPGHCDYFTADGKDKPWHREPSLKLVSRPKKKVMKTIERWVNIWSTDSSEGYSYATKERAEENIVGPIATVKLTGSYESEEE